MVLDRTAGLWYVCHTFVGKISWTCVVFTLVWFSIILGFGFAHWRMDVCAQWWQIHDEWKTSGNRRYRGIIRHGMDVIWIPQFFVDDNWYYPYGDIIGSEQFLLYAIIISTGLIPLSFVFYELFNTFSFFKNRFTQGPKFVLPESIKIFCWLFVWWVCLHQVCIRMLYFFRCG